MNWRQRYVMQELQRADRTLAAHGIEDSARVVQRLNPAGFTRWYMASLAFVVSLVISGTYGRMAPLVVAFAWMFAAVGARLIRKPQLPAPAVILVLGRGGRYIDDGGAPMTALSPHATIEFGSLWYAPGFRVTVSDGERQWVGELKVSRRIVRAFRAAWDGVVASAGSGAESP